MECAPPESALVSDDFDRDGTRSSEAESEATVEAEDCIGLGEEGLGDDGLGVALLSATDSLCSEIDAFRIASARSLASDAFCSPLWSMIA